MAPPEPIPKLELLDHPKIMGNWPDTSLKPKTYNKLVPPELDPNPILSRTDADLTRDVRNEMDSLGFYSWVAPDMARGALMEFHFRTPPKI